MSTAANYDRSMRQVVVLNPNLSGARRGDVVTAADLSMSEDKLDAFIAAGHAVEVHEPAALVGDPAVSNDDPVDLDPDDEPAEKPASPKRKSRSDGAGND